MASAVHVVRRFRQVRALVIGDAMLDSYLMGTAARLCSEGPVPVVQKTDEYHVPGGAANTAANIRALGASVMYLGVIGSDENGNVLREALREHEVDDRWLVEDPSASTLHKARILADGQYVVRFDEGDSRAGAHDNQRRVLALLDEAFPLCDVVVVSDYACGVLSDALIRRLRELREQAPRPLIVDSKQLLRFRDARATVITPNWLEARLVAQQEDSAATAAAGVSIPETDRVSRRLLDVIDTEHVAITMAGDGVLLASRNTAAIHLPAHPVTLASDVGAGDSFASGLSLALGAGAAVPDAAHIGIDAASIAVTKRFTSVVSHQELLQRVSLREHADVPPDVSAGGSRHALGQLRMRLTVDRQAGHTIVFTNGVFDLLHAGHIEFLRRAKALGDVLVVGVNSDRSARRIKGRNRPVSSERERLALVAALEPVDHVILFDEDTPAMLIRALRPHIHVKGGDYETEELPEAGAVQEVGGRIIILPLIGDMSTTRMIERITARLADQQAGVGQ
jgi:D-beta-D-heptose 7-phosphate kinase/D-beta-D-heptose 1-phosphate adenosyltransferase